ncbi:hypothetical protein [Anatilimnocola floriformis]|nr:hypothetical protein [Anatilimnocola floriformis]
MAARPIGMIGLLPATPEEILQRAIALGWGDADNSVILCACQYRPAP